VDNRDGQIRLQAVVAEFDGRMGALILTGYNQEEQAVKEFWQDIDFTEDRVGWENKLCALHWSRLREAQTERTK
jgi:hypothetical protein